MRFSNTLILPCVLLSVVTTYSQPTTVRDLSALQQRDSSISSELGPVSYRGSGRRQADAKSSDYHNPANRGSGRVELSNRGSGRLDPPVQFS